MHCFVRTLGAVACAACIVAGSPAFAQDAKPAEPPATEKQATEKIPPAPAPAPQNIGSLWPARPSPTRPRLPPSTLKNAKDEIIGRMFYVGTRKTKGTPQPGR